MNILWMSHNVPYPPKGGVLQRNYHLLRETASRHRVTLVTFNQKFLLSDQEQIQKAFEILNAFCERVEIVEIPSDRSIWAWWKLVIMSLFTSEPYTVNWLKSEKMFNVLKRVLISSKFDLVHVDTIGLMPYLPLFYKIPKVLNHHNIESDMMFQRIKNERNVFKKVYFFQEAIKLERIEKRFSNIFNRNLVVSSLDRDRLRSIVPNLSVSIVPNGVDTDYFQPYSYPTNTESLVMVGGMSWYPNRDAALYFFREIWPRLTAKCPKMTIRVIGRKPPAELISIARKDPRVSILGFVDDIRPYVHEASVYVCAIRDGGGTRLKILDALAMGKAIVCTSVACEGIEVIHDKHLLIADDPIEFAERVTDLLADPAKRCFLEMEARALVLERYDWKKIAVDLNAAHGSVIAKQTSDLAINNF